MEKADPEPEPNRERFITRVNYGSMQVGRSCTRRTPMTGWTGCWSCFITRVNYGLMQVFDEATVRVTGVRKDVAI